MSESSIGLSLDVALTTERVSFKHNIINAGPACGPRWFECTHCHKKWAFDPNRDEDCEALKKE